MKPFFCQFDGMEFRKSKLWREEMDILLTRMETGLQKVYKEFTGRHSGPSTRVHMMGLDELLDMMIAGRQITDAFGQREIGPCFTMAAMTNKQETESERHLSLNFVEFLEALARCCDKFHMVNLEDPFPNSKSRNPYLLDKKMECIGLELIQRCLSKKVADPILAAYREKREKEEAAAGRMRFGKKK